MSINYRSKHIESTVKRFSSELDKNEINFLLANIFGIRHSNDGLAKALFSLNLSLNAFPSVKDFLTTSQFTTLSRLSSQQSDQYTSVFHDPFLHSSNNPFEDGRLSENPVLAALSQPILADSKVQQCIIYLLKISLLLWRYGHPTFSDKPLDDTPNKIRNFCTRIRHFCKENVGTLPPALTGDIHQDLTILLEVEPELFPKSNSALRDIVKAINSLYQSNALQDGDSTPLFRPPVIKPTRVSPPTVVIEHKSKPIDEDIEPTALDTPIFRKIRYHNPAVNSEVELGTILSVEGGDEAITGVSRDGQQARLASARFRSAMQNQYLPFDWSFLNQHEVTTFLEWILSTAEINNKVRLAALLIIVSSSSVEDIIGAQYGSVSSCSSENRTLFINLSTMCWARNIERPVGCFHAKGEQLDLLAMHSTVLQQPLPSELHSFFQTVATNDEKFLFTHDYEQLKTKLEKLCVTFNGAHGGRITLARLRSVAFRALMFKTGDELKSSIAIANAEYAPSIANYYYSTELADVQKSYVSALSEIGFTFQSKPTASDPKLRLGSELYWPESHHKTCIESAMKRFNALNTDDPSDAAILTIHNFLACYTAWVIMCGTGIRPSSEFTLNINTFNEEWCVVSDKQKQINNQRLIPLCSTIKRQIEQYFYHLSGLSQRLIKRAPALAKQIGSLSKKGAIHGNEVSLFFVFDVDVDVDSKWETKALATKDIWNTLGLPPHIPTNVSRHWLISTLHKQSMPSEWVSALTGHIQLGQIEWAGSSLVSLQNCRSRSNKVINDWFEALGIKILNGISLQPYRPVPGTPKTLIYKPYKNSEKIKSTLTRSEIRILKSILTGASESDNFKTVSHTEQTIQKVYLEIERAFSGNARKIESAKNLCTRFVESQTTKNKVLSTLGYSVVLESESSTFKDNHFINLQISSITRAQWPSVLPRDLLNRSAIEQQAWLLITLTIQLLIVNTDLLKSLFENLPDALKLFHGDYWLEWRYEGRLVRRFLDPNSQLLLCAMDFGLIAGQSNNQTDSWGKIRSYADALLEDHWEKQGICKLPPRQSGFTVLIESLDAWVHHNLPGTVAEFTLDKAKPTSVSAQNIIALKYNAHCTHTNTQNKDEIVQAINNPVDKPPSLIELKNGLAELTGYINSSQEKSQRSSDSGVAKVNRPTIIKNIIEAQQRWKLLTNSELLVILSDYAIHLLRRKKRTNKYLSNATIKDYIASVGVPLLELSYLDNWLEADTDDLEHYYLGALNYSKGEGQRRRAKLLSYFHSHCTRHWSQSSIDLRSLHIAFYASRASNAHALIIPFGAYERTQQLLIGQSASSQDSLHLAALLQILVFRFGLRLGEALGLDTSDIYLSSTESIVYVRKNRLGGPKSRAGFRQVLAVGLTDNELSLLKGRLEALKDRFEGNPCAFFCVHDDPWRLRPRKKISDLLLKLTKAVTGDSSARLHHSRDTKVSTEMISQSNVEIEGYHGIMPWLDSNSRSLNEKLLGVKQVTRRSMFALSNQLGHAHTDTTITSYAHTFEIILHKHLCAMNNLMIPTATIANWYNRKANSLNKLKKRSSADSAFARKVTLKADFLGENLDSVITLTPFSELDLDVSSLISEVDSISFKTLETAIQSLEKNVRHELIGNSLGISVDKILELEAFCASYRKDRGFDCTENFLNRNFSKLRPSPYKIDYILELFESDDQRKWIKASKIWVKHYSPKFDGLLISDEDDLKAFIETIESIKGVEVERRFNESASRSESNPISREKVRAYSSSYRSSARVNLQKREIGQVFLLLKDCTLDVHSTQRVMITFHRAFFLLTARTRVF